MRLLAILLMSISLVACSNAEKRNKGQEKLDTPEVSVALKTPEILEKVLSETVRDVLADADSFELLTLDPKHLFSREREQASYRLFGGYKVLGASMISNAERIELLNSLYNGIARFDGMSPRCFNPRHGLLATMGENDVELVICFSCKRVRVLLNGKEESVTSLQKFPRETFNRIARAHKLKIDGE